MGFSCAVSDVAGCWDRGAFEPGEEHPEGQHAPDGNAGEIESEGALGTKYKQTVPYTLTALTPVLIVEVVEPSLAFWTTLGFAMENEVPSPDGKLLFASVMKDGGGGGAWTPSLGADRQLLEVSTTYPD
jgi:hypothetical protein